MKKQNNDQIHEVVRERYAQAATSAESCCAPQESSCCGPTRTADDVSCQMGYTQEELASLPEGANLGLGCGNPQAIAALRPGEVVLDLGSGAGIDCFLAAKRVGPEGRVIGIDMTPEMIRKANRNADAAGATNVEFRLGNIEDLPVDADSVDVIMSNCVINLSPDKPSVYREAFRVLKPGGRLAISDVVTTAELPEAVKNDLRMYVGCVAGALSIDELEAILGEAGFEEVRVATKDESREVVREWGPGTRIDDYIASATIEAIKP